MDVQFLEIDGDVSGIGEDIAVIMIHSGLANTKSEARRSIEQGAFRINDQKVSDKFARFLVHDDKAFLIEKMRKEETKS